MPIINKGFIRKRESSDRLPPGQYQTEDYPVLSLGPTPTVYRDDWKLKIFGLAKEFEINWSELNKLPKQDLIKDIHCVTKWSKFDMKWTGIPFEQILQIADIDESVTHVIFHSADGYTTNLPLEDLKDGKAWVGVAYEGENIPAEHGGPVRMVIPHLYFWKSAKWLTGIEFVDHDKPGFWEVRGYHNYGDPWKEQRYDFDE
jgi:DMSO/TMAO reductase YedYZ molybdopterin-dependent catalytic subunit